MLDPPGLRIDLLMLLLRRGDDAPRAVEDDKPSAGGSLVECSDICRHAMLQIAKADSKQGEEYRRFALVGQGVGETIGAEWMISEAAALRSMTNPSAQSTAANQVVTPSVASLMIALRESRGDDNATGSTNSCCPDDDDGSWMVLAGD
jgi:hypothetical protein